MKTNEIVKEFYFSDFDMLPIYFSAKIITFTTFSMCERSSGDEYILCKDLKGAYVLLKMFVDVDCDGTFYHAYFIDKKDDFDLNDFSINNDTYYDGRQLTLIFNHLRLSQK